MLVAAVLIVLVAGGAVYLLARNNAGGQAANRLQFADTLTESEKDIITRAVAEQQKSIGGDVQVRAGTSLTADNAPLLMAYVPVTASSASRQSVTEAELSELELLLPVDVDQKVKTGIAEALDRQAATIGVLEGPVEEIGADQVALIPAHRLNSRLKLLQLNGDYYLDSFTSGALFRQAVFEGDDAGVFADLKLNNLPGKDRVLSFKQTGVTALTRAMMVRLRSVPDATYFSEKIGDFLAAADITHVSNEVSFMPNCALHEIRFCAPPEMIEVLKSSGVDVVELTGNHNNDYGAEYNAASIELYHSLGWNTFGGGLNAVEAAKPFVAQQKGSSLTLLGYNYADGPGSGALAGPDSAGANGFNLEQVKTDIEAAKAGNSFVIVDIQFYECYAYPAGYVEYPQCDAPIPNQAEVFRQVIDMGADMVVGTSAHQPQTYELYNGKPIYYGLGNMYFDQVQWPGTERGIILTHYFVDSMLVQTRLTPTVYDRDLQTRIMDEAEAVQLLERLQGAAKP